MRGEKSWSEKERDFCVYGAVDVVVTVVVVAVVAVVTVVVVVVVVSAATLFVAVSLFSSCPILKVSL